METISMNNAREDGDMSNENIWNTSNENITWPVVVTLKHPVEFGSQRIDSLEFRRGKLGDLKGMKIDDVPSVDLLLQLASRMCGQPTKVIEMLDVDDAGEVLAHALGFFARCLAGGSGR